MSNLYNLYLLPRKAFTDIPDQTKSFYMFSIAPCINALVVIVTLEIYIIC